MYSLIYIYICFVWFFKVWWVQENQGVTFLVVPLKDAFAHYNKYSHMVVSLFELTKKNVAFLWNYKCQNAFDMLENALIKAPILISSNFIQPFILDVNWSIWDAGAILSQQKGKEE